MSAARDRLGVLRKVVHLRDRRLELARAAVATAQSAVRAAEAALAARDERLAGHERDRVAVEAWLTGGAVDARYVETALARRDAVLAAKADDLQAREQELADLAAAESERAEALRALASAQAKRDAGQEQLTGVRKAIETAREAQAQSELEDRGGVPLRLIRGGLA